jgi:hypothetical protein
VRLVSSKPTIYGERIGSQPSFSAKIDELRDENLRAEQELKRWRSQAAAESEFRHSSEHKLNQLKATNQALQLQLQESTATAEFFRDSTYQHAQVIDRIMELAEGLESRARKTDYNFISSRGRNLRPLNGGFVSARWVSLHAGTDIKLPV